MHFEDPGLEKYRASVDLSNFPKGFLKWYDDQADAEQRKRWFAMRYRCLKDHLYLSGFTEAVKAGDEHLPADYVPIMGMDFQADPHSQLFAQFIQKRPGEGLVLSDLDTQTKKRMILWPRGLFKTSAIVVEIVQTILNYPNVRICFLTGGDNLAKRQLIRIKKVFEKPSPTFRWLFPEFCTKSVRNRKIENETDERAWSDIIPKMGTAHDFTVPARTNDTFAEPTFAISTAKSVKSGSHFDVIFIDDLVNDQNYRSVKMLEKCFQDYLDICPLLDPAGFMIVTGTRYSFGDTYERIQDLSRTEERELGKTIWKFSIRDCWSWGCKNCEHTDVYHDYAVNAVHPPCTIAGCRCVGFESTKAKGVLFPRIRTALGPDRGRVIGHTLEFLEGERRQLGDEFFANQYENRPIATGAQTFTETLIGAQTLHSLDDVPSYGIARTFVVGDLAYVGEENRDFSVLFVCRLYQGQLFIFDCLFGNWDADALAENVVNIIFHHRPEVLYFEKFNGWDAYNNVITAKASSRNLTQVPIQWLKVSQTDGAKRVRIGSVKGPLAARRLWFYGGMRGYEQIVNQLCKWPKLGRHDDFADCTGMVVEAPTGYQLGNPPPVTSSQNWLTKLHQAEPVDDSYGDNGCGTGICC